MLISWLGNAWKNQLRYTQKSNTLYWQRVHGYKFKLTSASNLLIVNLKKKLLMLFLIQDQIHELSQRRPWCPLFYTTLHICRSSERKDSQIHTTMVNQDLIQLSIVSRAFSGHPPCWIPLLNPSSLSGGWPCSSKRCLGWEEVLRLKKMLKLLFQYCSSDFKGFERLRSEYWASGSAY